MNGYKGKLYGYKHVNSSIKSINGVVFWTTPSPYDGEFHLGEGCVLVAVIDVDTEFNDTAEQEKAILDKTKAKKLAELKDALAEMEEVA